MVVGDDDVQVVFVGRGDLSVGANAAVDCDQQLCLGSDPQNCIVVEPVAFVDPVRDIGADPSAQRLQCADQQGSRGDAVGVEIPVDAEGLPAAQRLPDALDSDVHVAQQEGVFQRRVFSAQKCLHRCWGGEPTCVKHLGQQRVFRDSRQKGSGGSGSDCPAGVAVTHVVSQYTAMSSPTHERLGCI